MPSVTVLMPVYNAEQYVRAAVESILAQSFSDFEFLVINDASMDRTRAIISAYPDKRIRIVDNEKNLGLTSSLNKGLRLAAGALIARQDADDVSLSDRLAQQVDFLRRHQDVALVGTQAWVINGSGHYKGIIADKCREDGSIRWDLLFDNSFIHTTVMFRKDIILDKLGGYDESFAFCQDYDLWSRTALGHHVHNLASRQVLYRIHSDSMTERMRELSLMENRRIIRRNLSEVFGRKEVSDEEVELIIRYRYGDRFDLASLDHLFILTKRLRSEYERLFPEVQHSCDFRRTIARQYGKLIYKVSPTQPRLNMTILSHCPYRFPLLQIAASWLAFSCLALLKNLLLGRKATNLSKKQSPR